MRIGIDRDEFGSTLERLAAGPQWHARVVHAEVDQIAGHPVGSLTFSINYRGDAALQALLAELQTLSADVEVLGHVAG